MTPGTGPEAVITVTRWPTSTAGSHVADLAHEEHAGAVDVLHDQADLVDVADERDARAAAGVHGRERVAEPVAAHVRELARRLAPDLCRGSLVARWADRAQQTVQQDARTRVDALLRHAPKDS